MFSTLKWGFSIVPLAALPGVARVKNSLVKCTFLTVLILYTLFNLTEKGMAGNLVHTLGKGGVVGVGHSQKINGQLLNSLCTKFHLNRTIGHGVSM